MIVTNFPEQTGTDDEQRNKDRSAIEELFKDQLKVNASDFVIQGTGRLGKEEVGKTRVLKVTLDREYMIGTILKATKNLSSISDPVIKKISIFKDLCTEDRELRRKLVTEMKAKNESLKTQRDPTTG